MNMDPRPYGEVEAAYLAGRITEQEWRRYQYAWRNGAARFSSLAWQFEEPRPIVDPSELE